MQESACSGKRVTVNSAMVNSAEAMELDIDELVIPEDDMAGLLLPGSSRPLPGKLAGGAAPTQGRSAGAGAVLQRWTGGSRAAEGPAGGGRPHSGNSTPRG